MLLMLLVEMVLVLMMILIDNYSDSDGGDDVSRNDVATDGDDDAS